MAEREIIARAIDDTMLGPSSKGSRFAAKKLAEIIEQELSAKGYRILAPDGEACFVVDFMERETKVPFGDMIGTRDAERILKMAGRTLSHKEGG